MNVTPREYEFIEDSGHGWLKVPTPLLKDLEIYDDISAYSYESDSYVYLEQDLDYGLFYRTMKRAERPFTTYDKRYEGYCYVRQLMRVQNGSKRGGILKRA